MAAFDRQRWRAAARITAALAHAHREAAELPFPDGAWRTLRALGERQQQARDRPWPAAAARLRQRLVTQLAWFQTEMHLLQRELQQPPAPAGLLTVPHVYQELVALQQEFADVEIDLRGTVLRVTTDDIVLDDIRLGPFEMVWNWSQLGTSDELKVRAREPNRPAGRDDVTHPHILNDVLCEGEAAHPLQQALRTGRLGDYFLILGQVLNTYNRGSPYVALSDWEGIRCSGCDLSLSSGEDWSCDRCGDPLCDDCLVRCQRCDSSGCAGCLPTCDDCGEPVCIECWPSVARRRGAACPSCTEAEHADTETLSPEHPIAEAAAIGAAVHPDRLVQAAVSAGSG